MSGAVGLSAVPVPVESHSVVSLFSPCLVPVPVESHSVVSENPASHAERERGGGLIVGWIRV